MRIAVTGASGFCGSHIARAAAALGADVVCLGRRPGPVGRHTPWDALTGLPELDRVDLVVHCAADVRDLPPGHPGEARQQAVNIEGTARLLHAAAGRPVIHVSSASVYPPTTTQRPLREDHPIEHGHLNAYGRTKAAADALALAAGAVVLRPRGVYGPGDPHLVPQLRARVRHGLLALPGRDVTLSLTSVANLADAALAAAGLTHRPAWAPGAYNITDAHPYRRDEAIRRVLAAQGVHARILHVPRHAARWAARTALVPALTPYALDQVARSIVLDPSRARAAGWEPRWDLNTVLAAWSKDFDRRDPDG